MVYAKRLAGTTLLGVAAGVMCWQGGVSVGIVYTPALIAGTILNRGFIGFVIGISALRWPYPAHGALLGVLGSLPMGGVCARSARRHHANPVRRALGSVDRADRHQGAPGTDEVKRKAQ